MLAFLFIALLYIRQNRFVTMEKQQKQVIREMEEIISTFIAEVKEENDQFIQKITKAEGEKAKKEEENVNIPFDSAEKNRGNLPKGLLNKQMVKAYKNTNQNKKNLEEDTAENLLGLIKPDAAEEKTLLDQAVDLQKQGKKIEEIAKILNKGKTEIELLLKFRQK